MSNGHAVDSTRTRPIPVCKRNPIVGFLLLASAVLVANQGTADAESRPLEERLVCSSALMLPWRDAMLDSLQGLLNLLCLGEPPLKASSTEVVWMDTVVERYRANGLPTSLGLIDRLAIHSTVNTIQVLLAAAPSSVPSASIAGLRNVLDDIEEGLWAR